MDLKPILVPNAISLVLLFLVYKVITSKCVLKLKKKPLQAPKPKGACPILGHLPLLAGPTQTFRTLGAMADKCGPIFTIQLGSIRTVVVSSKEAIKDCFTMNDNIFISRPDTASVKYLGYNDLDKSKFIFQQKRYDITVGDVEDPNSESERFRNSFKKLALLTSGFDFLALVPILGWLDLQGRVRAMKQTAAEVDYFMSSLLEEHIMEGQNGQKIFDFIHAMLSLFAEEDSIEGFDKKTVIKAAIQVFILAGSEPPVISMIWALSLIINNKEKLNRVQEELDTQVGREKWVQESDINKLPYLIAIVKETMRLYPSGPLSVPRESILDCHVLGYFVPKGTVLVTNLWKLHRDPNVWTDPDEFKPERFLMENNVKIDGRGQYFEYLPFGTGKRMCPGVLLSLQIVHLALAHVLQGFDFATYLNEKVDMSEGMGIALSKATPLHVLITPRLPSKLYQE